ncbi:MAG: antitoxin [Proteobacteria bacterium]|nr:MAG: antitoxin [Pseudomonadota bacterium]
MRKEYDFSKAIRNPYASKLKKQITIRIDENVIEYFKALADEFDMPYQNLINLYLKDCTIERRKPRLQWHKSVEQIDGAEKPGAKNRGSSKH